MKFRGTIIEESLDDIACLQSLVITSTKIEKVTESHTTPWLKQWTLHTVAIDENDVDTIAFQLSEALEKDHEWYADFKNNELHYIVFRKKIFKVRRNNLSEYEDVKKYGVKLGIPEYQLDFSPEIE